jgi:uncharacterized protein YggE
MTKSRTATVLGTCALALGAPAAASAATDQTITALGTGQAKVTAANRHDNASIKKAVDKAYAKAVPNAIADARADAARLAKASGLTLGAIQSVDENVNNGNGYYFGPAANLAPFGPDQYCGKLTRRVHKRDAQGRLHTVRRTSKRCFVPRTASTTLAVTFAATPAS